MKKYPLRLRTVLLSGLFLLNSAVCAQGYGAMAAQFKVTRIEHQEEIDNDYSSTRTITVERQALSEAGAVTVGRYEVSFNPDLETLKIEEAYTEKQNGQRIPVMPQQINEQKGLLAPGTQISWPNYTKLQLTFAQVQSGDKTFVRYRQRINQAALPQWLSHFDYLGNAVDIDAFDVQLSAPGDMPLVIHAQGLILREHTEHGRKRWQLQGRSTSTADERQMANGLKRLPFWMYSTLPSRLALGDAFTQALRQKILITPEIQALADQITQGASNDFGKAQAISRWIAKEMRYVAVFIGAGGYIPNDLTRIVNNRYGDCKDHSLLMMSLLKAVGVDSAPALINTVNSDWAPPVAAALYNHVLVYIPSLNLFTDPTAQTIPFGQLPWTDSAKPVVVGMQEGAKDMRTPAFTPHDNRVHVQSIWHIDAQGNAQADIRVQTWGEAATTMQNQLVQIPTGLSSAAVQRFLNSAGLKGKGFLQYPTVQRQTQEQSMSTQLELPQFLPNPEAASINPHPMVSSLPLYVLNNLGPQLETDRRYDMLCTPIHIEEAFELHLPTNAQWLSIPSGFQQTEHGIRYRSEYRRDGSKIIGSRFFERAPSDSGHICTVQEIEQRRSVLEAIRKDVRSTALFKLP